MLRAATAVLAISITIAFVLPTAQAALLPFQGLTGTLVLGANPAPDALFELASSPLDGLEAGEARLLDETLADPLALLELPDVPDELLGILTIDRLGPVQGPRVTEIPPEVTLGAVALADRPISAERLRSFTLEASIRNEDPDAQREDMRALLAGAHG